MKCNKSKCRILHLGRGKPGYTYRLRHEGLEISSAERDRRTIFLVLGTPNLDAVLWVGPHTGRVEGDIHLPAAAGHSSFDAAQDSLGLLSCRHTLLARVELFVHQNPQVSLRRGSG